MTHRTPATIARHNLLDTTRIGTEELHKVIVYAQEATDPELQRRILARGEDIAHRLADALGELADAD